MQARYLIPLADIELELEIYHAHSCSSAVKRRLHARILSSKPKRGYPRAAEILRPLFGDGIDLVNGRSRRQRRPPTFFMPATRPPPSSPVIPMRILDRYVGVLRKILQRTDDLTPGGCPSLTKSKCFPRNIRQMQQ